MLARQKNAPRGRTDRTACVKLRQSHSFIRHSIQIRRLQDLLTETAQIPVTQIIGEDQDDVRWLRFDGGHGRKKHRPKQQGPKSTLKKSPTGGFCEEAHTSYYARENLADSRMIPVDFQPCLKRERNPKTDHHRRFAHVPSWFIAPLETRSCPCVDPPDPASSSSTDQGGHCERLIARVTMPN